jgi:hypothetical protein
MHAKVAQYYFEIFALKQQLGIATSTPFFPAIQTNSYQAVHGYDAPGRIDHHKRQNTCVDSLDIQTKRTKKIQEMVGRSIIRQPP